MYIICSIGPKVTSLHDIQEYILSGMAIPRFNFSHVDYEKFNNLITGIQKQYPDVKILQDLQGNKIRVSKLFTKEIKVSHGDKIIFCLEKDYYKLSSNKKYIIIPISYEGTLSDFKKVKVLYMKDASMKFIIKNKGPLYIYAVTEKGGVIRKEKGINAPFLNRTSLTLTQKDKSDIDWALERGINIICLSFVTSAKDMIELREYVKEYAKKNSLKSIVKLWAKIECSEGCNNFEEILKVSDGIMLGRGDLRGEYTFPYIPLIQEKIIKRMKRSKKPLVIATYVLDSMKRSDTISIAELDDIYNFVKNDVTAVMLSSELTISKNPKYLIKNLDYIIKKYTLKLNENKQQ